MKNLLSLALFILLVSGLHLQASAQQTNNTATQTESTQESDLATPAAKAAIIQKKPRSTTQTVLNKMAATVQNLPLFGFIDDWYYTRYRFGGTTKKGVDCSSFTLQLFRDVYQISLPRTARQQYEVSIKVNEDEMQEGDLVFFNTRGGISHVGVYLVNGYFVHASSSRGVMVSNIREPYFSKRFLGARRIVGPMNGLL
jgi:cell wall-associated NlpC family hydrolase